jgi:DNA-binding SARP family transcriptional activator
MQPLRIHLFGNLDVFRDGEPLPGFPTQKTRGLFAFLALNRDRRHSREVLVGRFWGERPEGVARKNLRTDLWRIRSVLEPRGVEPGWCLTVSHDEVSFNQGAHHWLDIHDFEAKLDRAAAGPRPELRDEQARLLSDAVALYRGDLLEGVYDDWCVFERERLRLRYLDALERLMRHHECRGEWTETAAWGQRLLAHDPLREHVHRAVIRSSISRGDRASAVRQYETCARLLRRELDAGPMEETRALVAPLLSAAAAAPPGAEAMDEILARLHSAAQWLEETGEQVRIVIRDVERARALTRSPG